MAPSRKKPGFLLAAGLLALCAATAQQAVAAPACDRACLKGVMDNYLDAMVKHDVGALPVAAGARIIYNGKARSPIDNDDWKAIDGIAYRQYVTDPVSEQVALFGVATEDYKRGLLYVRLAVKDGKLTHIEMTADKRTQDGIPQLISPNPLFDYVLPKDQQRSREQLIAIGDSYFEALEKHTGKEVPITDDCRRIEDGVQVTLNPVFGFPMKCNTLEPFTYIKQVADRIYPIVDVERGLVLGQVILVVPEPPAPRPAPAAGAAPATPAPPARPPVNPATGMVFPPSDWPSKPRNTLIYELFKVVDGKIMEIQTIRLQRPLGWGGGWKD